jgi:hypothetical protein
LYKEVSMNIGADEIILWLRKNDKAVGKINDDLGKDICKVICDGLGGRKIADDQPSYWDCSAGAKNISPTELPKTAEQYAIDPGKLPQLFSTLNAW